jgi:hypothetical protein
MPGNDGAPIDAGPVTPPWKKEDTFPSGVRPQITGGSTSVAAALARESTADRFVAWVASCGDSISAGAGPLRPGRRGDGAGVLRTGVGAVAPEEQARAIQLLVERVEYDGKAGTIAVTFHPSGIKALASEHKHEVAA